MSNAAVSINSSSCLKDGLCISTCPCSIFEKSESGIPNINENLANTCIKCGHCASVCPGKAISLEGLAASDFQPVPLDIPTFQVFNNLVRARRSTRSFKSTPIPQDKIKELLETTRFCPTAKNTQCLSWLLIDGADKVKRFSASVIDSFRINERMKPVVDEFDNGKDPIHRGAPQVLVAYAPAKYPWGTMDAAIAIANLELAARSCGFGTCWGGFSTWAASCSNEVGKSIGLTDEQKIFGVLMIGYPQIKFRSTPPRKPVNLKII